MKRWGKVILYILLAAVVGIQFYRPERNLGSGENEADMLKVLDVPQELANKLKNSCYDCHSDRTSYPWYSQVAPVSWMLAKHIREGKEELNFSRFGNLERRDMIGVMTETCEVVEDGSMPLPGYVAMHKEAVFSEEEMQELCEWAEMEALKIMRE
jgi:hypothetical protein